LGFWGVGALGCGVSWVEHSLSPKRRLRCWKGSWHCPHIGPSCCTSR
jgi:hypothetical protein